MAACGMGALVFALHPVQAEPVCWVTGLKDLLCAFFCLLSLTARVLGKRGPEPLGHPESSGGGPVVLRTRPVEQALGGGPSRRDFHPQARSFSHASQGSASGAGRGSCPGGPPCVDHPAGPARRCNGISGPDMDASPDGPGLPDILYPQTPLSRAPRSRLRPHAGTNPQIRRGVVRLVCAGPGGMGHGAVKSLPCPVGGTAPGGHLSSAGAGPDPVHPPEIFHRNGPLSLFRHDGCLAVCFGHHPSCSRSQKSGGPNSRGGNFDFLRVLGLSTGRVLEEQRHPIYPYPWREPAKPCVPQQPGATGMP